MLPLRRGVLLLIFLFCSPTISYSQSTRLPSPIVPEGLGVAIHFTDPQPGEMKMLAESGVQWVRMDFVWDVTEKQKGIYDFSAYDRFLKDTDEQKIKTILILDYFNPLYDKGLSPHTDEARQAFARWAVAGAKHFSRRGIIWEMWNEPNYKVFWLPKVKFQDYIKLALEVGKAFQAEVPDEILVGPASAHIPLDFLAECFKAGLLKYWSAVTVHPYRVWLPPETATVAYERVRSLIKKYAPAGKEIPILSGEWGYSAAEFGFGEIKQAKFLARSWLNNLASGIPLSIWYDWHNDGTDPKDVQHNFGLVRNLYRPSQTPVYESKPAYQAAQTLTAQLNGFRFSRRLPGYGSRVYILAFEKGGETRIAAWTSSPKSVTVKIPLPNKDYQRVSFLGEKGENLHRIGKYLTLTLHDAPQYLIPSSL